MVLDLALFVVELAEHRVIVMSLPVLPECCLPLFLVLLPRSLFVVLIVDAGYNVELFGVVLDQHFLPLDWKPHLPVVEVEIGQSRVIYHIVGIPNGAQFLPIGLWFSCGLLLNRVQVDDVVGPLVLLGLSLSYTIVTM